MDVRVLELLASKICHDLISPVGAVNNGVEFLEDMGADALEEALSLIKFSAAQASAKLQAFRYAYGAGGAESSVKPEDIHKVFGALISSDGKIVQDWNPHADLGQGEGRSGFCKILMACLMLSVEFLPRGGTVSVDSGGKPGLTVVKASGSSFMVKDGVKEALEGTVAIDSLDPKTIHPYAISIMAAKYGYSVTVESQDYANIYIKLLD